MAIARKMSAVAVMARLSWSVMCSTPPAITVASRATPDAMALSTTNPTSCTCPTANDMLEREVITPWWTTPAKNIRRTSSGMKSA